MFKTLPREPKTFPYLTAQNLVLVDPAMLFAATKVFLKQVLTHHID